MSRDRDDDDFEFTDVIIEGTIEVLLQASRSKEVGEKMREFLLSLPYEQRTEALSAMDVCFHCGIDDRGSKIPCQCWNDE
jgi:hypothetical protein